jgi:plasmid stabilization system protein ParE
VDTDLLEAEAWYEKQQAGLGQEFLRTTLEMMSRLRQNPLYYRIRHRRKQVRWVYPRPFPYRIVFQVIGDTVVIHAVLHAARHGRHWQQRV